MAANWYTELIEATEAITRVKVLLEMLSEQEPAKLLQVKPIIIVLTTACDFLVVNLEIIRRLFIKS